MKPIRLLSGILTVGGWTLMSRILGFVRDVLIAGFLGPGILMDAYVAAFRLPNMFRRFFAEGAFNAAFVPMFSKRLEADENPEAFASLALSGLSLVLLTLTALSMIFMPVLVYATAEGFYGDARFDVTVEYGRIVFPYIFFISLAALLSGVLNATGRFAAAAAAPVVLNVLLVTAMTVAWIMGGPVAQALIWTIPFAGIAQLALVWAAADRAGIRVRPVRPRWTPEMKHLVSVAVPAALAGGVVQINLLVGQLVASNYEKAVSWLYSADRLYQLPLGVVGIAVGIVLLPDLSRRLKAGDDTGARNALSRAGELSLALTIPCAIALMIIPLPLVSVLFERGAFGPDDTAATALAVAIYGLGLPAFVLQKILQPVFFAREDTKSPFRFALVAMVVNAVLAVGLSFAIGWLAAAIATTAAAWVMVWQLARGGRAFGKVARFDDRFRRRIWRIIAASVLMGVVLWAVSALLTPLFGLGGWRWLALLALLAAGTVAYALSGQLLGAFRLSEFKEAMRR
ncbi:murein biosynthesis integral membrane protein MurJ [Roseovarius indicus]|uniref:Probable lipid II flippase MurJ n=1 Tax=Roseovarius indicus TaxID=540747 RepID=A0A0T5PFJ8_9RHOB|nr:murein biosynthesis integral membrane protein MurJ [Roseovarius indicus]KRS19866.1 multidrug transporter MurJ [Roseovarius indicus]QEW28762.1 putative peptidoglycan biosynthesis protein MurJ [Roseovarius indicus]SFD84702.1 putative peptidoglycan lipid II flippase [Roseovarius indicus]